MSGSVGHDLSSDEVSRAAAIAVAINISGRLIGLGATNVVTVLAGLDTPESSIKRARR